MASPVFNAMGNNGNMISQFKNFMNQMRGKNPQDLINQAVSSGRLTQNQLNQLQSQAQQMSGMLNGVKGMFGF